MQKERINKLRQLMNKMSVDCFLVTERANIFYLSGFTGDDGVLLITENSCYIITDKRFELQLSSEALGWKNVLTRDYIKTAAKLAAKEKMVAMAFESSLTYAQYDILDEEAICDIVPLSGVIEKIRSIKDETEIAKIRYSCEVAKRGYEFVVKLLNDATSNEITELDVANELDYFMKKNGASEKSFETILATGEHTTWPHGTASDKKIITGDLITLDYGYYVQKYTSDVTRTFGYGEQSAEVKKIYATVYEANLRTVAAVKAGISGQELDYIGRQYITDQGYGNYFNHGMGHGIGLSIHELPNIGKSYNENLEVGQIITIEPGVYVPGVGGVRIEDDILVTENGYEVLTDFGRNYLEV